MIYAGIGSRATPQDVLDLMWDFAYSWAQDNAMLRSGGAPGADNWFEEGVDAAGGSKEIYLPWVGFNDNNSDLHPPSPEAMEMAAQYHPGWRYLRQGAKKLMARNCHQMLGANLDSPVDLVVCWTPDGSLDGAGKQTGGTGQALRIAADLHIPVFNLQRQAYRDLLIRATLSA